MTYVADFLKLLRRYNSSLLKTKRILKITLEIKMGDYFNNFYGSIQYRSTISVLYKFSSSLFSHTSYFVVIFGASCLILLVERVGNLSISDQFRLVEEEPKLINLIQKYMKAEITRLDNLLKFKNLLSENKKLYANEDEFAWNPLAIYRTIKYLATDLDDVKDIMMRNNYDDAMEALKKDVTLSLNVDHLYEEIRHLVKLQRAYNVRAVDMMDGYLLQNVTVKPALTVDDCFHISSICNNKLDFDITTQWLGACYNRFEDATLQERASKVLIMSSLHTNDLLLSRNLTTAWLVKDAADRIIIDLDVTLNKKIQNKNLTTEQRKHAESLKACANDYGDGVSSQLLKCRYNHHNSPFLIIAPVKEEMLSLEPKISLFREVIYESEIEMIRETAMKLFHPATLFRKGVLTVETRYRPNQVAFFDHVKNSKYSKFVKRLSDLSSLSINLLYEKLQALYYAPGGFYRVHSDFLFNLTHPYDTARGNRVASLLMYFSDVILGGNTVFPFLKLSVKPTKGSALFWVNMHVNGSYEEKTEHAACPVIYGEKIACTQWFRSNDQDHWIAEPEDDKNANPLFNPNIQCRKRKASVV